MARAPSSASSMSGLGRKLLGPACWLPLTPWLPSQAASAPCLQGVHEAVRSVHTSRRSARMPGSGASTTSVQASGPASVATCLQRRPLRPAEREICWQGAAAQRELQRCPPNCLLQLLHLQRAECCSCSTQSKPWRRIAGALPASCYVQTSSTGWGCVLCCRNPTTQALTKFLFKISNFVLINTCAALCSPHSESHDPACSHPCAHCAVCMWLPDSEQPANRGQSDAQSHKET